MSKHVNQLTVVNYIVLGIVLSVLSTVTFLHGRNVALNHAQDTVALPLYKCVEILGGKFKYNGKPE